MPAKPPAIDRNSVAPAVAGFAATDVSTTMVPSPPVMPAGMA